MMLRLALLVTLLAGTGCDAIGTFIDAASDEGTVYECTLEDGHDVEYCYLDDAATELADRLHASCGQPSRRWPWFTNKLSMGCVYQCPSPGHGCNAKQGCYCP